MRRVKYGREKMGERRWVKGKERKRSEKRKERRKKTSRRRETKKKIEEEEEEKFPLQELNGWLTVAFIN